MSKKKEPGDNAPVSGEATPPTEGSTTIDNASMEEAAKELERAIQEGEQAEMQNSRADSDALFSLSKKEHADIFVRIHRLKASTLEIVKAVLASPRLNVMIGGEVFRHDNKYQDKSIGAYLAGRCFQFALEFEDEVDRLSQEELTRRLAEAN